MANIDKLIQDLQSDDLEKKYYACKQLEMDPQLPIEAIDALRIASKDPDPLITVTANRALSSQIDVSYIPQKETSSEGTHIGFSRKKIFYILLFSYLLCILCSLPSFYLLMTAEGDAIILPLLSILASVLFCAMVGMVIGTYIMLEYIDGQIWEPPYYIPVIICLGLGFIFMVLGSLLVYFYGFRFEMAILFLLAGYLLGIIIVLSRRKSGFQLRTYIVGVMISLGLATIFIFTSYGIIFTPSYLR